MDELCLTCGAYWDCEHKQALERIAEKLYERLMLSMADPSLGPPPTPRSLDKRANVYTELQWSQSKSRFAVQCVASSRLN